MLKIAKTITIVTSKTSQITIINMIMKKFEILHELTKYDTETWRKQMVLEKGHQQACSTQGCHKPSICKKCSICDAQ